MRRDIKLGIKRFYLVQLIVIAICSVIFYCALNAKAFISSVLGGFVCLLPGLLFALNLFRYRGAQQARKILSAFYLGEAMKLIITGILFAIIFMTYKVNAAAFFSTYILVQAVYWFAPCLVRSQK